MQEGIVNEREITKELSSEGVPQKRRGGLWLEGRKS